MGQEENAVWEVYIERIAGKPKTRTTESMTTDELIKVLKKDKGEHIIGIVNKDVSESPLELV